MCNDYKLEVGIASTLKNHDWFCIAGIWLDPDVPAAEALRVLPNGSRRVYPAEPAQVAL